MVVHVVRPGDTLYAIARRYGVSVGSVIAANRGLDPERLLPGTRVLVPHPYPLAVAEVRRHRVQPGDTLWRIAWRYGVPLEVLILANQLFPPYTIYPGRTILVPMAFEELN